MSGFRSRRGFALMIVVICLIVITTIVGSTLRQLVLRTRHAKQQAYRTQAMWLAESGIERAIFSLQQDQDYSHGNWRVSAEELDARHDAEVKIQIEPGDEASKLVVHVLAVYPTNSTFRAQVRKRIMIARP